MAGSGAAAAEEWEEGLPPRFRCLPLVCLARVGVQRGGERDDTGAAAA